MPTFLETVFGRKKPTSIDARNELAKIEAELAAAPKTVAIAEAALRRVADMTDAEHAEAEERLAAARRAPVRLVARAEQLRGIVAEAEAAEAAADLRAEAEAARKAMASMGKLLDDFDAKAAALAATAAEMERIDNAVALVNRKIEVARKAGLSVPEPVRSSQELFRLEPDRVEPDTEVVDERWRVKDDAGHWQGAPVLELRGGKMMPVEAGAELHRTRRIIPGKRRPGRSLASPTSELRLPATRLGGEPAWPRIA